MTAQNMFPGSNTFLTSALLVAASRALVAAIAVCIGLRVLRIGNVLVQKAAWALVLAAALIMPFVPQWNLLPSWLRLPAIQLSNAATRPEMASIPAASAAPKPIESFQPLSGLSSASGGVGPGSALRPANPRRSRVKEPRSSAPVESLTSTNSLSASPAAMAAPVARASTPTKTPGRLALFALLLYLAVAAALLLRLLAGIVAAIKLWRTAVPIAGLELCEPAKTARIRSSDRVSSPVNIGSGILLPANYTEWDEEKLRIVLAHERSHIRQGDFYLQILAGLYASAFWFSPLGWWLKRKLYELGEAISDRAGLEEAASRMSYAQLLLEFAALPRPTLTGVAMARANHLSQRIERLLNESHFRQAFAAGRRRALLAILLVPVALLAATMLVRVEAATPGAQASAAPAASAPSQPAQVTDQAPASPAAPAAAPATQAAPAPDAAPAPPALPAPPVSLEAEPAPPALYIQPGPSPAAPVPPGAVFRMAPAAPFAVMPEYSLSINGLPDRLEADSMRLAQNAEMAADLIVAQARQYFYRNYDQTADGDPYAVVESDGKVVIPRNDIFRFDNESIEKARKMAHGAFLWFEHDGKAYIVDDPSVVTQIEAMDKPMEDIQSQMRELGKQMKELGEQQRDLGKKMRETVVPTPDLSKEIADLNAAAADLKAKEGGSISQKDLADLQREIGRIQGQLGQLQGKIGAQQGGLDGQMGKFGGQMGQLGGQMGQLGAKMGEIARENQAKMKGIITDSLSSGKAKPVQ